MASTVFCVCELAFFSGKLYSCRTMLWNTCFSLKETVSWRHFFQYDMLPGWVMPALIADSLRKCSKMQIFSRFSRYWILTVQSFNHAYFVQAAIHAATATPCLFSRVPCFLLIYSCDVETNVELLWKEKGVCGSKVQTSPGHDNMALCFF